MFLIVFGSSTSAHNRGNRRSSFNRFNSTAPINPRSNQTASSTSAKAIPLYTPSENKAHKPADNKKLFVPQKQQTITKPKAVKPDAKQQKVIDSLNKEKDKIIKQSSDKSTNSDNTKETAKKTGQRKSILDKYSNRSSIEIKKDDKD